jgi:hypothetical protein
MPTEGLISGFAFRVERRSRSGRITDTTRRTSRDPEFFRPLDGNMSRMSMRRKAQEMRLPSPLTQGPRRSSIRVTTNLRCFLSVSYPQPIPSDTGAHVTHARPLDTVSRGGSR